LTYVGETLRVTALTSSIGTSTVCDWASRASPLFPLVARRLFDAGATLTAIGTGVLAARAV